MGMQRTITVNITTMQNLWPTKVVNVLQEVMEEGMAKGKTGWEKCYVDDHLRAAYKHLETLVEGYEPGNEDHLAHAFTRLMMAVAIECGYVKEGADA